MNVDIQFNPAVEPWESIRDGLLIAEDAGFGTAWVFDHFAGSVLRGDTTLECFTLLGAMAAVTTRIGLGSLVVNIANRHPGVMAMSAASVQAMSGGRFILGLGAGAAPNTRWAMEHDLIGLPLGERMADRHARLGATLDELDRWWAHDRPAELATFPLPNPRPPLLLGVNSVALAEMAALRTDGINVRATHPHLDALLSAAQAARRVSVRREREMIVSVWIEWDNALADPDHPARRRWEQLGVNRLVMVCLDPHDPAAVARFLR